MVDIRIATDDDVTVIEEVVRSAYEPWAERIGFRPLPLDVDYRSLVASGVVQVTDPELDGVLVLSVERGILGVENVAVHPDSQRRGTGRSLMAHAFAHAARLGVSTIVLYTHSLMVENIAWYASLGFVETHREPLPVVQRVHMARDLAT